MKFSLAILFATMTTLSAQTMWDSKTVETLLATLPDKPSGFVPPISDRAVWDSPEMRDACAWLIPIAEDAVKKPLTPWSDDLYLEFFRSGDRKKGETMISSRRQGLIPCVFAECLENKGRFLPWILGRLEGACEDPCWTIPAGDFGQGSFLKTKKNVDLVAALYSSTLATTLWILGDKVPDELRTRILEKMQDRVFDPMMVAMTTPKTTQWWTDVNHNWNSVCWNGVVGAALALHPDKTFRAQITAAALAKIPLFLGGFPADGYCYEGTSYWIYGFSNFLALREKIWQATEGKIDLCDDARVAPIALYGLRIQTLGGYSPAFGDCRPGAKPDMALTRYCNQAMSLEAPDVAPFSPTPSRSYFFETAPRSLDKPIKLKEKISVGDNLGHYFPDATVLISRAPEAKFAAAIKAGGNGNHSHDDIGSYAIYVGNEQPTGDPSGPKQYSANTFNDKRYDDPLMNSYGHPVPVVAGKQQVRATTVKPAVLAIERDAKCDHFRIDMRPAYAVPTLTKLERDFVFDREKKSVVVADEFEFSEAQTFEAVLIATGDWKATGDKAFTFLSQNGAQITVAIEASAAYEVVTDTFPNADITNTRIALRFKAPATKGFCRIVFSDPKIRYID